MSCAFSVQATQFPSVQELATLFNIRNQDIASLKRDKVFFFNIAENHEKELAVGAAIYMTTPPDKVVAFIKSNGMASLEAEVTLQHVIRKDATLELFNKLGFENNDKEAINFLSAKPGSQFNLSTKEFQILETASSDNTRSISLATEIYREILHQRWKNYHTAGLKGIASYDRGNSKIADPANELIIAALNHSVLTTFFPDLNKLWLNYPDALPAGITERFFLVNRLVENRPTPVLIHRLIQTTDTGTIILSRQFYVGHSYNSNQMTFLCLPYLNGTLLFYLNQSFTDQITGFVSGLKRPIGREQKRRRMDAHLKTLSNALK